MNVSLLDKIDQKVPKYPKGIIRLLSPFDPPHELVNHTNYYKDIHFEATGVNVAILVGASSLAFVALLGNFLLALAIVGSWKEKKRDPWDFYILNLCAVDGLTALCVVPFMGTLVVLGYSPFSRHVCGLWVYVDFFLIILSSFSFAAIMLNFLSLTSPFPHNEEKACWDFRVICSLWLMTNLIWAPPFLYDRLNSQYKVGTCGYGIYNNGFFAFYVGLLGFYVPTIIGAFGALMGIYNVKKMTPREDPSRDVSAISNSRVLDSPFLKHVLTASFVARTMNIVEREEAKAKARLPFVAFLLGIFITSRSPFFIYFGVGGFIQEAFPADLSKGVYWLMHSSSALIPLLHFFLEPALFSNLVGFFTERKVHPEVSSTIINYVKPIPAA